MVMSTPVNIVTIRVTVSVESVNVLIDLYMVTNFLVGTVNALVTIQTL